MKSGLSVLIVGGYGTFGGRIVELPENEPRLFRVEISHPLTGLIVRYRGWLIRTR
jgi:hypothetical protein